MMVAPTTAERVAIKVRGLHKAYRRGGASAPVLCGIDLAIPRGECVYLAGPSGSGKTTLLSILGCILTPDRGDVELFGQALSQLDDRGRIELRRHRIGFVFQRFHLIRGLTALENVCVPLLLRGQSRRRASRRAAELLETVGLAEHAHALPHRLSTGQCQRVAIARALVGDPDLILADEPTASLDAASGRQVMELLRRLTTAQGRTAVVVTHDQRIFPYADRVYWLDNGRIAPGPALTPAPTHPPQG